MSSAVSGAAVIKETIAVLGGGSWGTALARRLSLNGCTTRLWEYDSSQAERMRQEGENKKFLPGVSLPDEMIVTSESEAALKDATIVLVVVPSHVVRDVLEKLKESIPPKALIVSCAKGLEEGTLKRMSQVVTEVLPDNTVVSVSGPSHAEEVGREMPTTLVAASANKEAAQRAQNALMSPALRVYTSSDLVGVELGGSLKNPIAIAAGAATVLGLGDNAMGALITRGAAEVARLTTAAGGDPRTVMGLTGIGDLITTCISPHSRNRQVGERIGRGESLSSILAGMVMVAEGVKTSKVALELAERYGVEMPITQMVHDVLFCGIDPKEAVLGLMTRLPKSEVE